MTHLPPSWASRAIWSARSCAIRDDHPPLSVDEELLTLYRAQTRLPRRRQVMLDAVKRASDLGAERVVETLA